jgi:hypothetical protein
MGKAQLKSFGKPDAIREFPAISGSQAELQSLTMTLRYSHLAPSYMVKAMEILDKTLNEKTISTKLAQFRS